MNNYINNIVIIIANSKTSLYNYVCMHACMCVCMCVCACACVCMHECACVCLGGYVHSLHVNNLTLLLNQLQYFMHTYVHVHFMEYKSYL